MEGYYRTLAGAGSDAPITITMTHIDLIPGIECYDNCEKGWNFFAGESLAKLINEGKGMLEMLKSLRTV